MSIVVGILLYPARVSCINNTQGDRALKIVDPEMEPDIYCGEPGYDPNIETRTLGSSQGTGIDAQQPILPQNDNREIRTARSRYMQLLFFYLRNSTHGPFRY